jgi:hypothetical protein
MFKYINLSVFLLLSLTLSVFTVFAGPITIDGSINAGDPLGNTPSFSGSACFGSQPANYDTYTFRVDTDGIYVIDVALGSISDSVLLLYSPSFDTSQPLNNCIEADDDDGVGLGSRITRTLTANVTYVVLVRGFSGATGTYTLRISGPGNICVNCSPEGSCPYFYDGRINNCDTGNWAVIYGHDYDSGRGLLITDTEGNTLLQVSSEQIAAVPECPDSNTLIASGGGVSVYRLAGSCDYQVNSPAADGKTYVVNFDTLYTDGGYTSREE